MQKKFINTILPVILLLSACGVSSGESLQTSASAGTTVQTPETKAADRPDNEQSPSSDNETRSCQEIYAQTVTENTDSYTSFSLIYLNDDTIPELVVYNGYDQCYSIYTVKDDALFCLADSLNTVELTYFERTGILCAFARWNGGGDEGGYGSYYYQVSDDKTLTNSDAPILNFTYNAVYDEENVYTGEGITQYYDMGEETDESDYTERKNSLGITETNEKNCLANALEKEEMLALLSEN